MSEEKIFTPANTPERKGRYAVEWPLPDKWMGEGMDDYSREGGKLDMERWKRNASKPGQCRACGCGRERRGETGLRLQPPYRRAIRLRVVFFKKSRADPWQSWFHATWHKKNISGNYNEMKSL